MIKLIFIRHGATAGNLEKRYIGRTDEALCGLGIRQALALREHGFQVDHLFVSPALRTRQTAELVFPAMPYALVNGLMETDFGLFEGKTAAELSGEPAYQAWVDSGCLGPIPGGESVAEFKARCAAAFRSAVGKLPAGSSAAFVIHGGVIMAVLEAFARPARGFYDYHIGNGGHILGEYLDGFIRVS